MKQGSGIEADTRIGPLVSQEQLDRVTGYLDVGKEGGRQGGHRRASATPRRASRRATS
jgi:acyl-CoA reductase-like NAD-dependent aldehyde dehydrogenase